MKLNEAKAKVAYVEGCFCENPDWISCEDWETKWREELHAACRILDDRSRMQEVNQLILKLDAHFSKPVK